MKVFVANTLTILVSFMLILTSVSYQGQYNFLTPELFGVGRATMFQTNDFVYGYFHAMDGLWIIFGPEDDCKIVQLSGIKVTGIKNGYVPCTIDLNKWENKGTIDFRDTPTRPFWTEQVIRK